MHYHFKIHKEKIGYSAQGIELDGCFTQANNLKELKKNMQEALNLYLEEDEFSCDLVCPPDNSIKIKKNIVKVPVQKKA